MLETCLQRLRAIKPRHVIWLLIILYTVFFSLFTIIKHQNFQTTAGDLGYFDQAFWSTLQGRPLYISVWDDLGTTTLAHHVQPTMFLMLPIYAIYQSPETLLVLQSFLLALGALPLYWICKNKFNESTGIVFAALYLMYPALHGINQFDFHVSAIAIPFLLFAFHYVEEKRYSFSALFAILALMCKEDIAVTVGAFALYVCWKNREEIKALKHKSSAFIFSLSLMIIAAVWFFVTVNVIVPHFNTTGAYLHLGKFFPSLMRLEFPVNELLFAIDEKIIFALILTVPLFFLPLLKPSTFMITLPTWMIIFFSMHSAAYKIGYQYPYTLIPFIFVSAVYGLKKLPLNKRNLNQVLALLIVVGLGFMLFVSPSPLGVFSGNPEMPYGNLHRQALYEVIELIPSNASLTTQNEIFPHVSHRFDVHVGYHSTDEYVLIDTSTKWFELRPEEMMEILQEYGLVANVDNIYLFQRGYAGEPVTLESMSNHGIAAKLYNNTELKGFPVFETRFFSLDHVWGEKSPFFTLGMDNFSIRFEGQINFPTSGSYVFKVHSDNGFRLYINDELLTERWDNGVFDETATVHVEKGMQKIVIEYVEYSANAFITLSWKTPDSSTFEIVPEDNFYLL